jgi:hypothetical protein
MVILGEIIVVDWGEAFSQSEYALLVVGSCETKLPTLEARVSLLVLLLDISFVRFRNVVMLRIYSGMKYDIDSEIAPSVRRLASSSFRFKAVF